MRWRAGSAIQPSGAAGINRSHPLGREIKHLFLGSSPFVDIGTGQSWTRAGSQAATVYAQAGGLSPVLNSANYVSVLTQLPETWTIAALIVPLDYPSSGYAIAGVCESPTSSTFDRSIRFTYSGGGQFNASLNDGSLKSATISAGFGNGDMQRCVATGTHSEVRLVRSGVPVAAAVATTAVANSGLTSYASPEFCVGAANNINGQSYIPIALMAHRAWTVQEALDWIARPYQVLMPTRARRIYSFAAAGGAGRTALNTRSAPLGTEIGMNWRSG